MASSTNGKSLVDRRRRRRRNSEDEESVTSDGGSEASAMSGAEDEDAAEDGRASDAEDSPATAHSEHKGQANGSAGKEAVPKTIPSQTEIAGANGDGQEQHMVSIVKTDEAETTAAEAPDNDQGTFEAQISNQAARNETLAERRRREQDEYNNKRETDPSFIPNRGNFFMHDPRAPDQRGFIPNSNRGRGRGRGGHFGQGGAHGQQATESLWTHDLHDSINEPEQAQFDPAAMHNRAQQSQYGQAAGARAAPQPEYRPYTFSRTKLLGNVQVRVLLPGMKEAIPFTGVPVKQHTRLPDHRPPLRRDKPVRISLPDRPPRYIFPSQERSFIFIPRAMRPNQQGYGRARPGFSSSSRRTSAYGGSTYAPSIAASRRSSIARDTGRDPMFSPSVSGSTRHMMGGRPVVRLPQGMPQPPSVASPAASVIFGAPQPFPLPQTPLGEYYRDASTMHQPRPQKTISVSGIDSPAALSMHVPQQQDQQPFENQLPHHVADAGFGSSSQPVHYQYHGQPMTPLSHIPERAIHAQPFQPPAGGHGQSVYGQYGMPGGYYYPPVPVYVPQTGQTGPPPNRGQVGSRASASMMAHESNGMVYYLDPTDVPTYGGQAGYAGSEGYAQPPAYNVPTMGGQENSWYYPGGAGAVYYPQG